MTQDNVIYVMQLAIRTIIFASAPPLILGLVVGLLVSIFQTVTSINEQTLSMIPKILAVFISLIIFGPFILSKLQDLFLILYTDFSRFLK